MKLFFLLLFVLISCNGEIEKAEDPEDIAKPAIPTLKIESFIENDSGNDIELEVEDFTVTKNEPEEQIIQCNNDDLAEKLDKQKKAIDKLVINIQNFKKQPEQKKQIKKTVKRKVSIKDLLKDKKFKLTSHYGHKTNCRGKTYRKDFTKSRMYLHVDCNGNYVKQKVWRK